MLASPAAGRSSQRTFQMELESCQKPTKQEKKQRGHETLAKVRVAVTLPPFRVNLKLVARCPRTSCSAASPDLQCFGMLSRHHGPCRFHDGGETSNT